MRLYNCYACCLLRARNGPAYSVKREADRLQLLVMLASFLHMQTPAFRLSCTYQLHTCHLTGIACSLKCFLLLCLQNHHET